jgi:hypothetical protein
LIITIGGPTGPRWGDAPGFLEAAWMSLMRTLDAGTMGGDAVWGFRIVMLLVTVGGIFIVSTLIGVLSNGLEDASMNCARDARSSSKATIPHPRLDAADIHHHLRTRRRPTRSRKSGAVIVILADQDKVEMEDEIKERIPETKNTRIICRSGSPIDMTDLEIVSPHTARSIIVLPEGADPDTHVIKCVLAITNNPNRREEPYHIVTQIRDPQNMDVVKCWARTTSCPSSPPT